MKKKIHRSVGRSALLYISVPLIERPVINTFISAQGTARSVEG